jgi:hypothetical protein
MIEENNYKVDTIVRRMLINRVSENAKYCRTIGINKCAFWINDDLKYNRANVWYYSDDFDELIRNKNIDVNNSDAVRKLFYEEKDNLKHLSWKVVGYY